MDTSLLGVLGAAGGIIAFLIVCIMFHVCRHCCKQCKNKDKSNNATMNTINDHVLTPSPDTDDQDTFTYLPATTIVPPTETSNYKTQSGYTPRETQNERIPKNMPNGYSPRNAQNGHRIDADVHHPNTQRHLPKKHTTGIKGEGGNDVRRKNKDISSALPSTALPLKELIGSYEPPADYDESTRPDKNGDPTQIMTKF